MKKTNLSTQIFKRVMDETPADVTLWKYGKHPERWQECVLLYVNKETIKVTGAAMSNGIGHNAGQILQGLEKTGFVDIFTRALVTKQVQEWVFHFGNEKVIENDRHQIFVPIAQNHIAVFNTDVTLQIKAEKAKEEKIKNLEELNQKLVDRELSMIQLKSEIAELEKRN